MRIRPVGQAVKTLASHAGNMGSIPVRVTIKETQFVYQGKLRFLHTFDVFSRFFGLFEVENGL